MKKKKVIFFIESFAGGGAERVLLTILRNIDKTKFEITVLVVSDCGVYSREYHGLGIKIQPILNNRYSFLNKAKYKLFYNLLSPKLTSWWLFRKIEADTYIAFVEGYCTKILSYLSNKKRKLAWVHTDLKNNPWTIEKAIFKNKIEEKNAYRKFNLSVGVSKDVTDVLEKQYSLKNTITIYNPIDERRIIELSRSSNNLLPKEKGFNIISVGRLIKEKGYDQLISLMPQLLDINPLIKLFIIGEGEERQNLEKLIKKLSLTDKVTMPGFIENPYSLMKKMDLFVCSSVAEGFSLVVAEAFTVGLPVVSMECAGPCELLGHGKYGVLCHSYEELANTIADISLDENWLKDLREKSKVRATVFNTMNIVRSIEEIL